MANLTRCTSCDSNACQGCDNCNGTCQDKAQLVSKKLGTFSFRSSPPIATDQVFLSDAEWNNLITYIKNAYNISQANPGTGDGVYNGESLYAGKAYNNEFMSANMWNGAYARMLYLTTGDGTLNTSEKKTGGPDGDIVRAKYFTQLQNYANNSLKTLYCDSSCQGVCNNCNSQTKTESYCCSCDTCQNDNPTN